MYPPLEEAMAEAGLKEVDTYVSLNQNTVVQFVLTSLIVDLCLAVVWRTGSILDKRW